MVTQVSKQHEVSNKCPYLHFVQPAKRRTTAGRFVQIRLCTQSNKHQPNCCYSCEFVRDTTQDCVNPKEIPFGYNMRRGGVRVCGNVVVRVSLQLRIKVY